MWAKLLGGIFGRFRRVDYTALYDGKIRRMCERCGRDVILRVGRDGEILNMRFLGMDYVCEECGRMVGVWEEGEKVWVKKEVRL